jgi:predicted GNAT family N-acyltransferase
LFRVEPFDKTNHDRAAFTCEQEPLVAYLRERASQDIKKHVAAVFVLTPDGKTIAGYHTLSQYAVDAGDLPDGVFKALGLPKYPQLPATLVGRLARSLDFKGQGIGDLLLMDALQRSLNHSKSVASVASVAVVVDAKDEVAKAFYGKHGFIELPEHLSRSFLPMKLVEQIFAA